jgi:pSer/pThr/pTyr-binding forkhead associated (FHA) protein
VNALLKITEPTGHIWEMSLEPGRTYSIGRAKENDIVLNDRRVSRKHAHIASSDDEYKLIDGHYENGKLIRSVNHVFVNRTPKVEHVLEQNDVITIGETDLQFRKIEVSFQPAKSVHVSIQPSGGVPIPKQPLTDQPTEAPVSFDDSPLGRSRLTRSSDARPMFRQCRPPRRQKRSKTCGGKPKCSSSFTK